MKSRYPILLIIICFQLASINYSSAQKLIKIDEQLKENSQAMPVKQRGITTIGKYEFGPYKIIASKSGWEKVSSKSPLFGDHTSINSSSKMSFVLVNSNTDTCIANIRILKNIQLDDGNWFSQTFLNWSNTEVKKGEQVFETEFTLSADTTPWRLTVVSPVSVELDNGVIKTDSTTKFRGLLTDENTFIEIKKVTLSEDGKKSLFYPLFGYQFWQGSKSVAAVQVLPNNKMYVWIRDDLENKLKFILANGAIAMLIKPL